MKLNTERVMRDRRKSREGVRRWNRDATDGGRVVRSGERKSGARIEQFRNAESMLASGMKGFLDVVSLLFSLPNLIAGTASLVLKHSLAAHDPLQIVTDFLFQVVWACRWPGSCSLFCSCSGSSPKRDRMQRSWLLS